MRLSQTNVSDLFAEDSAKQTFTPVAKVKRASTPKKSRVTGGSLSEGYQQGDIQTGSRSRRAEPSQRDQSVEEQFLVPEWRTNGELTQTQERAKQPGTLENAMYQWDMAKYGRPTYGKVKDPERDQAKSALADKMYKEFGDKGTAEVPVGYVTALVDAQKKLSGQATSQDANIAQYGSNEEAKASASHLEQVPGVSPMQAGADVVGNLINEGRKLPVTGQAVAEAILSGQNPVDAYQQASKAMEQGTVNEVLSGGSKLLGMVGPQGVAAGVGQFGQGAEATFNDGDWTHIIDSVVPVSMIMKVYDPEAKPSERILGGLAIVLAAVGARHGIDAIKSRASIKSVADTLPNEQRTAVNDALAHASDQDILQASQHFEDGIAQQIANRPLKGGFDNGKPLETTATEPVSKPVSEPVQTPTPVETPKPTESVPETPVEPKSAQARARLDERIQTIKDKWESGAYLPKNTGSAFGAFEPAADLTMDLLDAAKEAINVAGHTVAEFVAQFPKEMRAQAEEAWNKAKTGTEDPIKATGLANQIQAQHVAEGLIKEIPSSESKTPAEWLADGQKAVADGADYISLARDVANGKMANPTDVGILQEGNRLLMKDVNDAHTRLMADPSNKKLQSDVNAAQDRLQGYLEDVQAGKGQWHNLGQAWQAAATVDTGSYAAVLQRARSKPYNDPRVEAELTKMVEDNAKLQAEIDRLKANPTEFDAKQAVSRARSRKYDKETLKTNIDTNARRLKELFDKGLFISKGAGSGPGGINAGANEFEAIKVLKEIALDHARLHLGAPLEEIVVKVQDFLGSHGLKVSRQDVIDAMAHTESNPRSEAQKQLQKLRNQAKRESTDVVMAKGGKLIATAEERAARKAIKDAKKKEWRTVKDAQDAHDAIERLADGKEKDAYRQWWRTQAAILDAKEALRTGSPVGGLRTTKDITPEQAQLNKLRQMAKLKTDIEANKVKLEAVKAGAVAVKKKVRTVDDEIADLQAQRRIGDSRVRNKLNELDTPKALRVTKNVVGTARGLTLGSDLGILTRQGLFGLSRPKEFVASFKEASKAMFSEKNLVDWVDKQESQRFDDGKLAMRVEREAGLSTTDVLNTHEELILGKVLGKILGPKLGGAGERFQGVFINTLRKEIFRQSYEKGLTAEELKSRAQYINNVTGRGNLDRAPSELTQIFMTSPRYERSRWAMLGQPVKDAYLAMKNGDRGAMQNVQDMAATIGGLALLYKTAELAGYKTSLDPKSDYFLKLRRGNEVWDVTAGMAPRIRDIMRAVFIFKDHEKGKTLLDIGKNTMGRTINPAIRTPIEQGHIAYQKSQGVTDPKSPITGYGVDGEVQGWGALLAPLVLQSMYKAYNDKQDVGDALGAGFKEFIGGGVNYYPEKTKSQTPEQIINSAKGKSALTADQIIKQIKKGK